MNKYFKKSTKRSVISMLSIAITLCLLFSLLFPGKAVQIRPRNQGHDDLGQVVGHHVQGVEEGAAGVIQHQQAYCKA